MIQGFESRQIARLCAEQLEVRVDLAWFRNQNFGRIGLSFPYFQAQVLLILGRFYFRLPV
jgi:hypothetical protein